MRPSEANDLYRWGIGVLLFLITALLLACKPTRTFRDGDYEIKIQGDSVEVDKIENPLYFQDLNSCLPNTQL